MIDNRDNKKENAQEKSFSKVHINWYPGHMFKTKKQIIEDIKLIDIVIELLDARIPYASKNPDMQRIIQNKKRIVLLNKSDLADDYETKKWVKYYSNLGIKAIPCDSNQGKGIKDILKAIEDVMEDEMEKAAAKGRIKKNIRIMILGIPNVGKSSLINRLCGKKTAVVGNRPGVTKQKQWVRIANNIELLDTPGVLWPKFEDEEVALNLAYTGSIKDEVIEPLEVAFKLLILLYNNYKKNLMERYKLSNDELENIKCEDENEEVYNLMKLIGKKRGAVISGGEIDDDKTAKIILTDFRDGKLGKITLERANER